MTVRVWLSILLVAASAFRHDRFVRRRGSGADKSGTAMTPSLILRDIPERTMPWAICQEAGVGNMRGLFM